MTAADPPLISFVAGLLGSGETGRTFRLSPELVERLLRDEVLIRSDTREFALPERIPELTPRFPAMDPVADSLAVNPDCHLQLDDLPPRPLAARLDRWAHLGLAPPLLWIDDPGSRILLPHTLGSTTGAAARALLEGRTTPEKLPRRLREILACARVLVPRGDRARRMRGWRQRISSLRASLRQRKLAVLPPLLPPLQIAAWRRYARDLAEGGRLRPDGHQVEGRLFAHREPRMEFLHGQTVDLISRIVGNPVKGSYSFFAVYPEGSVLKRHTDRPQCRWNVSLIVDADPETQPERAWPLYVETPQGPLAVPLPLGGGVLYSGTEVAHWREPLGAGNRMSAALFHYVEQGFEGGLD